MDTKEVKEMGSEKNGKKREVVCPEDRPSEGLLPKIASNPLWGF